MKLLSNTPDSSSDSTSAILRPHSSPWPCVHLLPQGNSLPTPTPNPSPNGLGSGDLCLAASSHPSWAPACPPDLSATSSASCPTETGAPSSSTEIVRRKWSRHRWIVPQGDGCLRDSGCPDAHHHSACAPKQSRTHSEH